MKNQYDEEHLRQTAQRVVQIASQVIAGQVGIIEGARRLAVLGHEIADDFDPDFMPFTAIDSETDHLPVGAVRELWSAEVLRVKDKEIEEAEAMYRPVAEEACHKLIRRYGQGG